jgi:hypothetical protein
MHHWSSGSFEFSISSSFISVLACLRNASRAFITFTATLRPNVGPSRMSSADTTCPKEPFPMPAVGKGWWVRLQRARARGGRGRGAQGAQMGARGPERTLRHAVAAAQHVARGHHVVAAPRARRRSLAAAARSRCRLLPRLLRGVVLVVDRLVRGQQARGELAQGRVLRGAHAAPRGQHRARRRRRSTAAATAAAAARALHRRLAAEGPQPGRQRGVLFFSRRTADPPTARARVPPARARAQVATFCWVGH